MTEKPKTLILGTVIFLAQAVIAWAVWLSAWCMARNWSEGLAGVALPVPTDIALRHGQAIPIVATILTVAIIAVALRRNNAAAHWLIMVAVLELLALAVFAVAITIPALTITYRLAP